MAADINNAVRNIVSKNLLTSETGVFPLKYMQPPIINAEKINKILSTFI